MAGTGMTLLATDSDHLLAAIRLLLAAKGIASSAEIAERIEVTDRASPGQGARMVARAWADPDYRALLLEDGSKAAEMLGIPMRGMPPLGVLENVPGHHHLVVCTLCSCYPRAVLGYPPYWYKSAGYRARAVRDPRGLLAEWGTELPEATKVTVVDSTADYRWMVLPMRPIGTDGWTDAQLAAIVREGDMIGVTVPTGPDHTSPALRGLGPRRADQGRGAKRRE
jgi:nitrile hydratase